MKQETKQSPLSKTCPYCGEKCYHGEGCDEWNAGGFNTDTSKEVLQDKRGWFIGDGADGGLQIMTASGIIVAPNVSPEFADKIIKAVNNYQSLVNRVNDLEHYIGYVQDTVSRGAVPFDFEDWTEIGKPLTK